MRDVMTYRRSAAVEETLVGDRVVLYHRSSGAAIVLNPTASILWSELLSERDLSQLQKTLMDRFPRIDRSRIQHNVESCLVELANHHLISARRDTSQTVE